MTARQSLIIKLFYQENTMSELLTSFGLSSGELTQMITLAIVLLIGLFLLRTFLKLTATLFRVGCFAILFIVAAVFAMNLLN